MHRFLNVLTMAVVLVACESTPRPGTSLETALTSSSDTNYGEFTFKSWREQHQDHQQVILPGGGTTNNFPVFTGQTIEKDDVVYLVAKNGSAIWQYVPQSDTLTEVAKHDVQATDPNFIFYSDQTVAVYDYVGNTVIRQQLVGVWVYSDNNQWVFKSPRDVSWCSNRNVQLYGVSRAGRFWVGMTGCFLTYDIKTDSWGAHKSNYTHETPEYEREFYRLDPRLVNQ